MGAGISESFGSDQNSRKRMNPSKGKPFTNAVYYTVFGFWFSVFG